MKKMKNYHMILVYILVLGILIGIAYGSSKAVTVLSEKNPFAAENTIIIDAGHGDPDGDYAQLIRSIQERLLVLPQDVVVFPGHGDTTTIGDEMKYNPYL